MNWHERFGNMMMLNEFKVIESDKCIFYKLENSICTIKSLYVNNLLMIREYIHVVNEVKSLLSNNFDMKDFEEVNVNLSIRITNS
jgi:hypothetical protein